MGSTSQDPGRLGSDWSGRLVERIARTSFGALLWVWLVIVIGCGGIYWVACRMGPALLEGGAPLAPTWHALRTAVYFSFVTATSVGFGDVVPVGLVRVVAVVESAAGLLIFGCIVSKLVSHRQEQLLEETHRIAFEDRLGRVRTNLHLVLSELQGIALEGGAGRLPPERMRPRLESAAMVFGGEMRAIHDLLYRPQQAPDEAVLEALLANLAAGLREFCDLLAALPEVRAGSALLDNGLTAISRLAGEICGDCVPRQYAPELKVWMDRIQQLARELSPPQEPSRRTG